MAMVARRFQIIRYAVIRFFEGGPHFDLGDPGHLDERMAGNAQMLWLYVGLVVHQTLISLFFWNLSSHSRK